MPEVFRSKGYVFFFYMNEGQEPMHVHVRHAGGFAKFWIMPLTYLKGVSAMTIDPEWKHAPQS